MVQTHTGFGTCVTRKYPYPYLPKPIPVLRRVWVWVLNGYVMADPDPYPCYPYPARDYHG